MKIDELREMFPYTPMLVCVQIEQTIAVIDWCLTPTQQCFSYIIARV